MAAGGIYFVFALLPAPRKVQTEANRMKGLSKEDIKKQGIQLRAVYVAGIFVSALVIGLVVLALAAS